MSLQLRNHVHVQSWEVMRLHNLHIVCRVGKEIPKIAPFHHRNVHRNHGSNLIKQFDTEFSLMRQKINRHNDSGFVSSHAEFYVNQIHNWTLIGAKESPQLLLVYTSL